MTTRRQILAITAGALFAPLLAHAQQVQKPWRIGYLSAHLKPTPQEPGVSGGLLKGLRDLGHVEGRDFLIEWKFAEGKYDQLDVLAGELVKSNVNVIIANAPNATRAAQTVTSTIPIIFVSGGDPVQGGFVKSLARPGGNITGFYNLSTDLVPKQLEQFRRSPTRGVPCRAHPERRIETGRFAGGAIQNPQLGHQRQDREDTRHHHSRFTRVASHGDD